MVITPNLIFHFPSSRFSAVRCQSTQDSFRHTLWQCWNWTLTAPDIANLINKYEDKPKGNVVFYGSSSIRLWPRLQHDFPTVIIENWGFGGSTLEQCAHFFGTAIVPRQPHSIVFYAGDNDLFLGRTSEDVWSALRALLDERDEELGAVPFAFISLKPSPARHELREQIEQANQWCWTELQSHDNTVYVDIYHAMLDGAEQPRREMYAPDGLHLSRAGYAFWGETLRRDVPWLMRAATHF